MTEIKSYFFNFSLSAIDYVLHMMWIHPGSLIFESWQSSDTNAVMLDIFFGKTNGDNKQRLGKSESSLSRWHPSTKWLKFRTYEPSQSHTTWQRTDTTNSELVRQYIPRI